MAAEAALRDSAHQAERELSKNIIELQAQEKKDRDSADSALAKRIEEFDGAMKVQVERTDGAVKRVDALEARARHAEESVKQDKEDRIAANTKETESRDAANRAIAVLATRIDEVEAKKHEVQSSAQKSDAEAAEKMAALQSNLAFLGKLLEESKSEMEAKLALEAKTSQDVTAVTAAKLKALHRDVSLEIHDNQQQLLDKLAVDKSKLDEKLDAGMSELETKLDALHSGQQKQEGNLQALETRLNQKLGTDTAATLQAMQRDMSIEIHDKHTELLKILATNKGELEEKMGAGQGELKDKQHAQERELKALETRLIFKIDGVAAAAYWRQGGQDRGACPGARRKSRRAWHQNCRRGRRQGFGWQVGVRSAPSGVDARAANGAVGKEDSCAGAGRKSRARQSACRKARRGGIQPEFPLGSDEGREVEQGCHGAHNVVQRSHRGDKQAQHKNNRPGVKTRQAQANSR